MSDIKLSLSETFNNLDKLREYKDKIMEKIGDQQVSFERRKEYQETLNRITCQMEELQSSLNDRDRKSGIKNLVKKRPDHRIERIGSWF